MRTHPGVAAVALAVVGTWLSSCGGSQPSGPSAVADPIGGLREPSGASVLSLRDLPAQIELGSGTPPDLADVGVDFVMEFEEVPNPNDVARRLTVLRGRLPTTIDSPGRFAPPGMSVLVEGKPVPFGRGKAALADDATWRINGKHLILSYPGKPADGSVVVHMPSARARLHRHDPQASGLSREAFVKYDVTLKGETRHGLLLTGPSSISWDVDLPQAVDGKGVWFKSWLTLERAPFPEPAPDPATLVVTLEVDGQSQEIGRSLLKRGEPFTPLDIDLSRWGGKRAKVALSVDTMENPWFDWVFVGSPTIHGPPPRPPRHVVVLAMDTTRPDHFGFYGYGRETTPELDAIARQSITFDRAWSVAPRTRPSFRSATTGRLPLDAVGAKNLGTVFHEQGFATAGIVANLHLQPRFDFDEGFDWWRYENNADAEEQVDIALKWLRDNEDRDTFLFLHFMDPHMPYKAPGAWQDKFVTDPDTSLPKHYDRWEVTRWTDNRAVSDQRKAHIEALHDGELAYMSHEIGRFFEGLDLIEGRNFTVLHTDHGEEFWDHGGFEHNHTLYDEVTRAILWFRPDHGLPRGVRREVPATLMDIAPTLYEVLGLDDTPTADGLSLKPVFEAEPVAGAWDRPLPVAYLQYEREQWGVVVNGHKYRLYTGTGDEVLYDLANDPKEMNDVSGGADLQPYRDAVAAAHKVAIRHGLRIHVSLRPQSTPFTVKFPVAVLGADVLDPEATIAHRANLEWGEPPRKRAEEVGAVTLAEDRRSLVFTPGSGPVGVLWVQADAPIDLSGVTVERAGSAMPMAQGPEGLAGGSADGSVRVQAGHVLVPPPSEAARMAARGGDSDVDDDDMDLLKELGYVEEHE